MDKPEETLGTSNSAAFCLRGCLHFQNEKSLQFEPKKPAIFFLAQKKPERRR